MLSVNGIHCNCCNTSGLVGTEVLKYYGARIRMCAVHALTLTGPQNLVSPKAICTWVLSTIVSFYGPYFFYLMKMWKPLSVHFVTAAPMTGWKAPVPLQGGYRWPDPSVGLRMCSVNCGWPLKVSTGSVSLWGCPCRASSATALPVCSACWKHFHIPHFKRRLLHLSFVQTTL